MAKYDITNVIRGDTYTVNVNLKQDLTGSTVFFTVSPEENPENDDDAIIKKVITTFDEPTEGKFSFQLLPSDTYEIEPDLYWYDIQIVRGPDLVQSTQKARFGLVSDITRRTAA